MQLEALTVELDERLERKLLFTALRPTLAAFARGGGIGAIVFTVPSRNPYFWN
jgi:hypothetical protein